MWWSATYASAARSSIWSCGAVALIAFVEVKGRRTHDYGRPVEAITRRKRREIESGARWWVARHRTHGLRYRFDVVKVKPDGGGGFAIRHLGDAWRPA